MPSPKKRKSTDNPSHYWCSVPGCTSDGRNKTNSDVIRGCKVYSFIRIQDQSVNLNYDGNGFNKFFETKTILLNDTTRSVLYIL